MARRDRLVRVGRLTRARAVPDTDRGAVRTAMRTLADRHGACAVRMVVRFT
ncbi:hypothetical protein AB0D46_00635 [Streptomyces sp. NPDC048383]|uniref:hypothetical protein n=1 Tax=Streptomyces sp. NPDC048383 TaxID=3155386 RepID=UPI003441B337